MAVAVAVVSSANRRARWAVRGVLRGVRDMARSSRGHGDGARRGGTGEWGRACGGLVGREARW
ncbi:hypothetical protein STTU_0101 [Streptomyces sp. Tu6071]|nr:hypothetical protein STTU_0101 [Streptomyces sp. Tu6071]